MLLLEGMREDIDDNIVEILSPEKGVAVRAHRARDFRVRNHLGAVAVHHRNT